MLRALFTAAALLVAAPAMAQDAGALERALRIDEVMEVMALEGVADGAVLRDELLPDTSATRWNRTLRRIYEPARMHPVFAKAFAADLATRGGVTQAMLDGVAADPVRKAIAAEIAARHILLDDAAEDRARLEVEEMRVARDPRLAALHRFSEVNGLMEMNVAGGLNATLAFFHGMQAAGAFPDGITEQDMLRDVWGQEAAIRHETEVWLDPYLLTAFRPLSDAELAAYTDFSATHEGQALNAALFAGFDALFVEVSRQLGLAAGREMLGHDI